MFGNVDCTSALNIPTLVLPQMAFASVIAVGQDALRSSAPTAVVSLLLKMLCRKRRTFAYIYKEANGLFQLKRNHSYYLQVQCQMFVTGSLFCDFVVFTEKALVVVRIMPDSTAWEAALQKAKSFFNKCILPALMQATPCEGESSGVGDAGENCVAGGMGRNSIEGGAGKNCVEGGVGEKAGSDCYLCNNKRGQSHTVRLHFHHPK